MTTSKARFSGKSPSFSSRSRKHQSSSASDNSSCTPLAALREKTKSVPTASKNGKRPPSMQNSNQKNNKRNVSSSSDDSISSESIAIGHDEGSEDSNDGEDEEDTPAKFAPSYGKDRGKHRKAGRISKNGLRLKRRRYHENESDDEGNSSAHSVSSVSSVSIQGRPGDSDDEYAGVDDAMDADDEDMQMEKLEEKMILESENERVRSNLPVPRGSVNDDWMGLDDFDHRPLYSAGSLFENEQFLLHSGTTDVVVDANVLNQAADTPAPRRVHFADTDDSSDSDKTSDDELFSDFLQQDRLDPDLRRMIESEYEPMIRQRSPNELFVNHDFNDLSGNIYHVETDSSVANSSGYECKY